MSVFPSFNFARPCFRPGFEPVGAHGGRLGVLALSVTVQGSGTLGGEGVLGHKGRGGGGITPVDRTFVCSGRVLVRLLHRGPTKVAWFARATLIAKTWDVIHDAMRQGARLLISPSGQEAARDMTLGEMVVVGNQLTLELRWSGVGGGAREDEELFDAAKCGDKSDVATALSRSANVNAKNDKGYTPLIWAVINGDVEVVQILLAAGADVNAKDNSGYTPLMKAGFNGHVEVVRVLLAAGADLNAKNEEESTPLIQAVTSGQVEVVQVLLAAGAELSAQDNYGQTALDYAKEWDDIAIIAAIEQREWR